MYLVPQNIPSLTVLTLGTVSNTDAPDLMALVRHGPWFPQGEDVAAHWDLAPHAGLAGRCESTEWLHHKDTIGGQAIYVIFWVPLDSFFLFMLQQTKCHKYIHVHRKTNSWVKTKIAQTKSHMPACIQLHLKFVIKSRKFLCNEK